MKKTDKTLMKKAVKKVRAKKSPEGSRGKILRAPKKPTRLASDALVDQTLKTMIDKLTAETLRLSNSRESFSRLFRERTLSDVAIDKIMNTVSERILNKEKQKQENSIAHSHIRQIMASLTPNEYPIHITLMSPSQYQISHDCHLPTNYIMKKA